MRIDELDVSERIAGALQSVGFEVLHPPQAEAIPIALTGRNLVAAIPTASGKSLIGYVPALKTVEQGRKVLYIVPLKALASEKKDDFDRFSDLGVRAHLSTGDLDSEDRGLENANVVVATSEKADSMIRHGSRWMDDVGLVIADEIHMIHDPGRGPTLEVAITKLMRRNSSLQVIALSATISNAQDLAEWLNAELVTSTWRPIPLKEGVYFDGSIRFDDGSTRDIPDPKPDIWHLVKQAVEDGGQSLVFVNARRSTESLAVDFSKKMAKISGRELTTAERKILEGDTESTSTGKKLADCISGGVAFHNAGLTYRQRKFVEEGFRAGTIKCIIATPTLAAGINLPARRVIIRDTARFEANSGNTPLPVMEIKQMCGRAGRPGYDPYGEAVLIAKSEEFMDHLFEDYIHHDTERLTSKLFNDRVLRSHILGLIATGDADSEESIVDFLRDTFFGTVSQLLGVESVVSNVVQFLADEDMVSVVGDTISIQPFGKRVSDLYIDPVSASILRDAVMRIRDDTDPMLILIAAAMTPDVLGMYPRKGDEERIKLLMDRYEDELLVDPDDIDDYIYDFFKSDLKSAMVVNDWIEEVPEDVMTSTMGIGPGDIRSKVDMMDWIIYSMSEIAYIFNPDAVRAIRPLTIRIRYGVKAELSELVSLRGVGRTRARTLFDMGIRTKEDIATMDVDRLSAVPGIGKVLAKSMYDQCGGGTSMPAPVTEWSDEDEEAMLDAMAAEYGESVEMPVTDGPVGQDSTGKKGKKVKGEETGPRQASLFDF